MNTRRKDPIFGIQTPIVFSHRGGAKEAPESTEEAFRNSAIKIGVDVLELDIQVTKDCEIVVWHGPKLDIVHDGNQFLKGRDIRDEFFHQDLKGSVCVIHPNGRYNPKTLCQRRLLTLDDFIVLVKQMEKELNEDGKPRTLHLNIELKKGHKVEKEWIAVWDKLFGLLDSESEKRRIILASAEHVILESLRDEMGRTGRNTYITNLSVNEQLNFRQSMPSGFTSVLFKWVAPLFIKPKKPSEKPYAFETYFKLASEGLVQNVREDQSAFYVFLTGLFKIPLKGIHVFPSVDNKDYEKLKKVIEHLLDAGVDGIMTDYPEKVMKILRELGIRD